jgi:UDP-N-acetylglucosamine transferase subunit ALG13
VIFVTVGTNEAHFDRLLEAVAELGLDERVLIQHGHSSPIHRPGAEVVDFLPFEEMTETIRRARAVVTHAGVGTIMVALANAKRPIVFPRRAAYGEAVDDHQLQVGRRFAEAGLVTLAETREELGAALGRRSAPATTTPDSSSLAKELRDFLEQAIAPSSVPL